MQPTNMPNPFANPGMPVGNIFGPKPSGGMNVDDLVKRIDAKIAEIEEEERQEKLRKQNMMKNEKTIEEKEEPKRFDRDEITDDQFFDDFFSDDE